MQLQALTRRVQLSQVVERAASLLEYARSRRLGRLILSHRGAVGVVEVALVAFCAYQAALIVWALAAPGVSPSHSPQPEATARPYQIPSVARLTTEDMFHPSGSGAPGAFRTTDVAAPETSLNLQLFGLRAPSTASGGSAIIRRPDGSQDVFFTGQEIIDGVTLDRIRSDHVVIRRMGVQESLYLDVTRVPASAAAQSMPEPATDQVSRRRISATAAEVFEALQVAPGRSISGALGLVVRPGSDPSLFSEAGFEPGDILLAVNGQPTSDLSALPALAQSLQLASRFNISIDRQGQSVSYQLLIDR